MYIFIEYEVNTMYTNIFLNSTTWFTKVWFMCAYFKLKSVKMLIDYEICRHVYNAV